MPLTRKTPLRAKTPMSRSWWARKREPSDPALPRHGRSKMPPVGRERLARGADMIRAAGPRKVSPERAAQLREYAKLWPDWLAERPWCESPWPCGQRATQVHHRMGRIGWRLLAVQWWAASCTDCNVVRAEQTDTGDAYDTHWKVSPDFTGSPDELPILPLGRAL